MSYEHKIAERRRCYSEMVVKDEEALEDQLNEDGSRRTHFDPEKRVRREIANSNERRRMQSINLGYDTLKVLLPHHDGDKLSKAAILQQTAEHIKSLEAEKSRLLSQNSQLRSMIHEMTREGGAIQASPPPKRKKHDTECSDEGISMVTGNHDNEDNNAIEDMKREMVELRYQLECERQARLVYEERSRSLATAASSQLYPDRLRQLAQAQVQAEYQEQERKYLDQQKIVVPIVQAREAPIVVGPPLVAQPIVEKSPLPPAQPTATQRTRDEKPKTFHPSPPHSENIINSSMSRRNLETIVEAIRHLEGEREEDRAVGVDGREGAHSAGEESGISASDQDDSKSDSSGRDSPVVTHAAPRMQHPSYAVHAEAFNALPADKYRRPLGMQLLFPALPPQYLHRPGVIVHKSS